MRARAALAVFPVLCAVMGASGAMAEDRYGPPPPSDAASLSSVAASPAPYASPMLSWPGKGAPAQDAALPAPAETAAVEAPLPAPPPVAEPAIEAALPPPPQPTASPPPPLLPDIAPPGPTASASPPAPQVYADAPVAPVGALHLRPSITAITPPRAAPPPRVQSADAKTAKTVKVAKAVKAPPAPVADPTVVTPPPAQAVAATKTPKTGRATKLAKATKTPPPVAAASPAPAPPPVQTADASDQHARLPPHIYSVARQYGLQPDPDALPAQFFADQPGSDLAAPPAALPPRPVPGAQTVSSTAPQNTPANRARAIALDTPSPDGSE